jgi:hypothetical protein
MAGCLSEAACLRMPFERGMALTAVLQKTADFPMVIARNA